MAKRRHNDGFTLVELVIAMAMFTLVLGATAQALISYYVALDLQNQRHTAMRNCTAVISQMREVRDANDDDFPGALTDEWANNAQVAGVASLPQEVITVNYVDANANPLQVTVRSSWVDIQGRPVSLALTTMLTSQ